MLSSRPLNCKGITFLFVINTYLVGDALKLHKVFHLTFLLPNFSIRQRLLLETIIVLVFWWWFTISQISSLEIFCKEQFFFILHSFIYLIIYSCQYRFSSYDLYFSYIQTISVFIFFFRLFLVWSLGVLSSWVLSPFDKLLSLLVWFHFLTFWLCKKFQDQLLIFK